MRSFEARCTAAAHRIRLTEQVDSTANAGTLSFHQWRAGSFTLAAHSVLATCNVAVRPSESSRTDTNSPSVVAYAAVTARWAVFIAHWTVLAPRATNNIKTNPGMQLGAPLPLVVALVETSISELHILKYHGFLVLQLRELHTAKAPYKRFLQLLPLGNTQPDSVPSICHNICLHMVTENVSLLLVPSLTLALRPNSQITILIWCNTLISKG